MEIRNGIFAGRMLCITTGHRGADVHNVPPNDEQSGVKQGEADPASCREASFIFLLETAVAGGMMFRCPSIQFLHA